jgi:hypothetical protein
MLTWLIGASIYRKVPVGSLLLWKGKKESYSALSCESIY